MSRTSTLILLGVLIVVTPFSGLPMDFRSLFEVIFGACVVGIGLALRAREVRSARASVETPISEPAILSPEASPRSQHASPIKF